MDEVIGTERLQVAFVAEAPGHENRRQSGILGGQAVYLRVADVDGVFLGRAESLQGFPDHVRCRLLAVFRRFAEGEINKILEAFVMQLGDGGLAFIGDDAGLVAGVAQGLQ